MKTNNKSQILKAYPKVCIPTFVKFTVREYRGFPISQFRSPHSEFRIPIY